MISLANYRAIWKFSANVFFIFFFFNFKFAFHSPVHCLIKTLTCRGGRYECYSTEEASVPVTMVLNRVTCRMISPYKVNWHFWLEIDKKNKTKKTAVSAL